MSLSGFLLARIAEDEAEARGRQALRQAIPERERAAIDAMSRSMLDGRVASRLGDPAHVLAECEAKRRIVELHEASVRAVGEGLSASTRRACQALGAVYADHPDYREEWRV